MAKRSKADGSSAVMWFRNDLRLADNAAVAAACADGARVVALFVLDPKGGGRWAPGGAGLWWLHGSLAALAEAIGRHGGELVLRRGDPRKIVPEVADAAGAEAVHCGCAHEPATRAADKDVAAALERAGRRLVHHRVATLRGFDAVKTKTGAHFAIYAPFAKASRALGAPDKPMPAPKKMAFARGVVRGEALDGWGLLPTGPDWAGGMRDTWTPGEAGAHARLDRFVARHLPDYADERDHPANADGTSMLSPHLHWGELSPNQVWHAVGHAPAAAREKFENEVLWHDFAAHVLWNDPELPDRPQRAGMAKLRWRRDTRALRAWQKGLTGVPIVDAGMRQLWRIGWMHNRVRMITASFVVKHALIDWTVGESWFWDTLVDADLATNAMSWQWIAGSGSDSAPFFRVFNPVGQSRRFDPEGDYIRRWVPELAKLPDKFVHAPFEASDDVLDEAGVALGNTYPKPIVDLAEGRDRALAAFKETHA